MEGVDDSVLILGGGLTGLSSGYVLSKAGYSVKLFEGDAAVGGLSKTISHEGFRFDLGGHRFFTKKNEIDSFVTELMEGELVKVSRKSKIFMLNRYFDYPLKPMNAVFGLGIPTTLKILGDYGIEKLRKLVKKSEPVSLEDWVVGNFGRKMFDIYFKGYSEKVWGIDCSRISAEWVEKRISGLSLATAVKNAFFRFNGKDLPTLVDRFMYPSLGIGRISERLKDEIEKRNTVRTGARVERVCHDGIDVQGIVIGNNGSAEAVAGGHCISSIPITGLVKILDPAPPDKVLEAASRLKFRDLIIVAVMIDKKRVTDQTWIYIPEKRIPFGRIHEPTNWSEMMAPEGKTVLVVEFFSFRGDAIWNESDERLIDITVDNLDRLGFVGRGDVIGGTVVRAPKAYPLFEVGYNGLCKEIYDYLKRFRNLHIAGRSGMFRYYNMDHAIESGITTAKAIMEKNKRPLKDRAPIKKNEKCAAPL